jgi:hypothetical protein
VLQEGDTVVVRGTTDKMAKAEARLLKG